MSQRFTSDHLTIDIFSTFAIIPKTNRLMLIVFVLYLLALTAIVIYSTRKSKTNSDFVLGGKKISGVSLAISERATGESSWLLLGLTGHAFLDGYSSVWGALGCVMGIVFIWTIMAEPLRKLTEETGALTISSLFTKKFPGSERSIGILSASIVGFFFLFYIAAQYSGAGKVFQEAFGIGIIGFVLVKNGALGENVTILASDAEQILPAMVMFLVTPILAGILLSGAVSAMMSTASSQLMVCSSAVSEDLYHDLSKSKRSERQMLWVNRLLIFAVGLVAFFIALWFSDTVYGLVSYAWAGIGSSFGPAILLLLFWKRFSKAGVYASLIGGTSSAILWKNFLLESTGISERLGSFVIAFILVVLFSLMFPKKDTPN